jgi:hypothetical protein
MYPEGDIKSSDGISILQDVWLPDFCQYDWYQRGMKTPFSGMP